MAKLFIGGLPGTATTAALHEYFGQFGILTDAVSMDGRGFGFVTYENDSVAMEVIASPHVMDGRQLDVKQATVNGTKGPVVKGNNFKGGATGKDFGGKGGGGGGAGFVSWASGAPVFPGKGAGGMGKAGGNGKGAGGNGTTDKIFVGGLPPGCEEEKLMEHFMAYGQIVDAVTMKDRATGAPRGFGFVTFDNTDSADAVMADLETHTIDGKWIECKRADGGGGKGGGGKPAFDGGGKGGTQYAVGYQPGGYGGAPAFAPVAGYAGPWGAKGLGGAMGKGYSPY